MPLQGRTIRLSLTLGLVLAGTAIVNSCGSLPMGLQNGHLGPCPDRPNCVSSEAPDPDHKIAPLSFAGEPEQAFARLHDVVKALPRTTIVTADERYMHVEFTSLWFRFTDDLELLLDKDAGCIQVRSASRLGYSDLGANRERVEQLRRAWQTTPYSGHRQTNRDADGPR